MAPVLRRLLASPAFHTVLYRFIRLYSGTFRLKVENEGPWRAHLAAGGRVLLCAWHQQFFPFIRHFQSYRPLRPGLMISRSRDGAMIAGVARRSGWQCVRGSSSAGGRPALVQMIRHLQRSGLAAHILDGPRGPAGVVKRGAVWLAGGAGAVMVPVYAEASRRWVFDSWDRFVIPKPFARVTIRFGDPLPTPDIADPEHIEKRCRRLERIMRPMLIAS